MVNIFRDWTLGKPKKQPVNVLTTDELNLTGVFFFRYYQKYASIYRPMNAENPIFFFDKEIYMEIYLNSDGYLDTVPDKTEVLKNVTGITLINRNEAVYQLEVAQSEQELETNPRFATPELNYYGVYPDVDRHPLNNIYVISETQGYFNLWLRVREIQTQKVSDIYKLNVNCYIMN